MSGRKGTNLTNLNNSMHGLIEKSTDRLEQRDRRKQHAVNERRIVYIIWLVYSSCFIKQP